MPTFERICVVGATGPTGRALVAELVERDQPVRVVSRRGDALQTQFPSPEIDKRPGDALAYDSLAAAVDGCDLVVNCIGLPAVRMADHPATARNVARAAAAAGARCLQVSSYWSFMPIRRLPLDERHPRAGGPPWARLRREAEDVLRDAGAAVVHLPDFFGPHAHTGTLHNALVDAVNGRPMNWIGAPDVERDYAYVPDAMRTVADLLAHDASYGEAWIVPGSGPISARGIAGLLSDVLGRPVRVRAASPWLLRAIGLFHAELRGFLPLVPEYVRPIAFDGAKLERLLGALRRTPYAEALRKTVASLRPD